MIEKLAGLKIPFQTATLAVGALRLSRRYCPSPAQSQQEIPSMLLASNSNIVVWSF